MCMCIMYMGKRMHLYTGPASMRGRARGAALSGRVRDPVDPVDPVACGSECALPTADACRCNSVEECKTYTDGRVRMLA